jgi:hypothetical protein
MRMLTRERERENERFKITGMFDNGGADKDCVLVSGRVGIFSRVRQSRGQASKQASIHQQDHIYNEKSIQ